VLNKKIFFCMNNLTELAISNGSWVANMTMPYFYAAVGNLVANPVAAGMFEIIWFIPE